MLGMRLLAREAPAGRCAEDANEDLGALRAQILKTRGAINMIILGNVGKTAINHPFGNGLYHLFTVIWGMVYYCFTHINFNQCHGLSTCDMATAYCNKTMWDGLIY